MPSIVPSPFSSPPPGSIAQRPKSRPAWEWWELPDKERLEVDLRQETSVDLTIWDSSTLYICQEFIHLFLYVDICMYICTGI